MEGELDEEEDDEYGDDNEDLEESDPSSPCVICFCMPKSTILLPCRHYCVCEYCADKIKSFS